MNLEEYESRFRALYSEFADIVRFIIEKAIEAEGNIPRPQSIQCRAKSTKSLKARLQQGGLTDSVTIETDRKDLAGARLIFYTNTDVDRFLNSRLIPKNFTVDWESTKIHHPTAENDGVRYQAIHYTVSLNDERTKLSEYSRFQGMRCEIQIQTILNHAWSETSHDIVYKDKRSEGFGSKAMESISKRFDRIMDKYLLPAGYEFQRVQHDYERLQQGKELFDRDAISALENAKDNNERYELLSSLKDYVLPNYDDLAAIYPDLSGPLVAVAKVARTSPLEPIKTTFGDMEGRTATAVELMVVEIFDALKYLDVERTFLSLCEIYEKETIEEVRKRILEAINHLAQYDLHVWQQAGPQVQLALSRIIDRMDEGKREVLKPIIIAVWSQLLDSDLTGTTWKDNSVELSSGALPVSDEISGIRSKAMSGLFGMFAKSGSEPNKRDIIAALRQATHVPNQATFSNELLALTLENNREIVALLTEHAADQPFELLEHLESELLFDFRRARDIAEEETDRFNCRAAAKSLMEAICKFRDIINDDRDFVRYKTLVGYESIFPGHWEDEDFDFEEADSYRTNAIEDFIESINTDNAEEWLSLIERCADTESNDLATFPFFGKFIIRLGTLDPEITEGYLLRASDGLLRFLPAFLDGLFESQHKEIYQRTIERYFSSGAHLASLVRHWRSSKPGRPEFISSILTKAIANDDSVAVTECVLFAIEANETEGLLAKDNFFLPAMKYLTGRKDTRWIYGAVWVRPEAKKFFSEIAPEEAGVILDNLLELPRIEHASERFLGLIAGAQPRAVWEYFGRRLDRARNAENEERYQDVPYRLQTLAKELSRDAKLAVDVAREWYRADNKLFQYKGGRFLSAVFPTCPTVLSDVLRALIAAGAEDDADFVLDVMRNYKGELSTHDVLKDIVAKYPSDVAMHDKVKLAIDSTGVVWGEFGFVEAFRMKKASLVLWYDDVRPEVTAFAKNHIRDLDLRIVSEQRRADESKRRFDDDNDEPGK